MQSKFTGGLLGLIGISILQGLIITFTLGIGTPWAVCLKENWVAEHTINIYTYWYYRIRCFWTCW